MQTLRLQKLLSGEISRRRILVRPPEPPPESLLSEPSDSIYFGRSALLNVPVFWNYKRLANPHIAIMGMTGSGKSYFIKTFLTRSSIIWGSNALILDWSGEYVPWVNASGGTVIHLGREHALNLLDTGGAEPSDRIKQILGAFEILTDLAPNSKQQRITQDALEMAYKKKGWKISSEKGKAHGANRASRKIPPTLHDVEKILAAQQKARKKDDDIEACLHRIRSLLQPGRDYFARQSTLSLSKLTSSGLVCIDLSSLPSESDRSLAGLTILQFLKEKMRNDGWRDQKALKLIIVADEAWKIAQNDKSDLVAIVREGRKYAFGLIVASQNPSDMSKTILSNAATVMVFRLQLPEFKSYVRSALHYGERISDAIEKFGVGQAAVHMAFSKAQEGEGTFLLSRIDGEEPLVRLKITGGVVDLEVDREEFRRRLWRLGCTDSQVASVSALFEKSDRTLSALDLAGELSKFGFSRPVVLVFLRELGLPDAELVKLFSRLAAKSLGVPQGQLANLVVSND